MTKITKFTVDDVRFPTSKDLTGSDAIHTDPDYSATYVTVYTSDNNLKGFGIAFTIGKGNDIVAECIKHFFPLFTGKTIDEIERDIGRIKKEFRNKKKPIVLIAGCVAQAEGEVLLKKEKYIDAVIGPQSYHEINNMILNLSI